jgi:hypothetical protein
MNNLQLTVGLNFYLTKPQQWVVRLPAWGIELSALRRVDQGF